MTETKWSRFDFVPVSCKRDPSQVSSMNMHNNESKTKLFSLLSREVWYSSVAQWMVLSRFLEDVIMLTISSQPFLQLIPSSLCTGEGRISIHFYSSRGNSVLYNTQTIPRADFHFFKGGVEKFLVGCKRHHWASFDIGGVKQHFGGVEHFIRGVREILGGSNPPQNDWSVALYTHSLDFVLWFILNFLNAIHYYVMFKVSVCSQKNEVDPVILQMV